MVNLTALIEHVCVAHLVPDTTGPLLTFVDRAWAYCPGRGRDGHDWRRVPPTPRALADVMRDRVTLICGGRRHLEIGVEVPDRRGILTIAAGRWAYCSAARDEPHDWQPVAPLEFSGIDHGELAARFGAGS